MADIFISYAHEDQAFVRRMVPALEGEGFSVWWDHTIPPGQSWDTFIARGIKEARACVVVWSSHSVGSEWVKEEASLARASGKYLPVQIDASEPPIGFTRIQAAQLVGWSGDGANLQWRMLLGEVRRIMETGGEPASQPRPNYSPSPQQRERSTLALAGMAIGAALIIGLGTAGYWYAQSNGLFAATQVASNQREEATTAPPNSEVEDLRRQVVETQAALEEERRERETATASEQRRPSTTASETRSSTPPLTTPLPIRFNIEYARSVLGGNINRLESAFVWSSTPQGSDYWSRLHESGQPLPPEARATLEDWVRRYENGERGAVQ